MGNVSKKLAQNNESTDDAELYNVVIIDVQPYIFHALKNLLHPDNSSPQKEPKFRRVVFVEGRKISIVVSFHPFNKEKMEKKTPLPPFEIEEESLLGANAVIVCAESPLYEEHIQKLVDSPYPIPSVRLLVGKEEESKYEDVGHGFQYYRTSEHIDGVVKVIINCTLELLLMGQMTKGAKR